MPGSDGGEAPSCHICLDDEIEDYWTLSCHHILCTHCAKQRLLHEFRGCKAKYFTCALCRQVTEVLGGDQAWPLEEGLVRRALVRAGIQLAADQPVVVHELQEAFAYCCTHSAHDFAYPYHLPTKLAMYRHAVSLCEAHATNQDGQVADPLDILKPGGPLGWNAPTATTSTTTEQQEAEMGESSHGDAGDSDSEEEEDDSGCEESEDGSDEDYEVSNSDYDDEDEEEQEQEEQEEEEEEDDEEEEEDGGRRRRRRKKTQQGGKKRRPICPSALLERGHALPSGGTKYWRVRIGHQKKEDKLVVCLKRHGHVATFPIDQELEAARAADLSALAVYGLHRVQYIGLQDNIIARPKRYKLNLNFEPSSYSNEDINAMRAKLLSKKTRYLGVRRDPIKTKAGEWVVYVQRNVWKNQPGIGAGRFATELEAARAHDLACLAVRGREDPGRLNFDQSTYTDAEIEGHKEYYRKRANHELCSSRYHGVRRKQHGKWMSSIRIAGHEVIMGTNFKTEEEAARARDMAVISHFGRSSNKLNFPASDYSSAEVDAFDAELKAKKDKKAFSHYRGVIPSYRVNGLFYMAGLWVQELKRKQNIGFWATEEEAAMAFDRAYLYVHRHDDQDKVRKKLNFPNAPYCNMPVEEVGEEYRAAVAKYRPKKSWESLNEEERKAREKETERKKQFKPPAKRPRPEGPVEARKGHRVRAMFDGKWVHGVVTDLRPGQIYVEYDDGDQGWADFPDEGISVYDDPKSAACPHCPFAGFGIALRKHLLAEHNEGFKCPKEGCEWVFLKRSILKNHVDRVHNDIPKKYVCEQCGKGYHTSANLKVHIELVHLKLRKYKCPSCGVPYSSAQNLKRHMEKEGHKNKPSKVTEK